MKFHSRFSPPEHRGSALLVSLGFLALFTLSSMILLLHTRGAEQSMRLDRLEARARALALSGMERATGYLEFHFSHYPKNLDFYSASEGASQSYFYGRPVTPTERTPIYQSDVPLERAYWVSLYPRKHRKQFQEAQKKSGSGTRRGKRNAQTEPNSIAYRPIIEDSTQRTVRISNIGSHQMGTTPNQDSSGEKEKDHYGNSEIEFGYSGELPSSVPGGKDIYALKIQGAASKIYINGPVKQEGEQIELARNQRLLLNNLGEILDGVLNNHEKGLGDLINRLRRRKGGDLHSIESLKELESGKLFSQNEIDILKNYLTPYAWMDQTTLDPRSITHPGPHNPGLVKELNPERQTLQGQTVHPIHKQITSTFSPGVELLADLYSGGGHTGSGSTGGNGSSSSGSTKVLQPRAPVNINSASKEVIQAVLMNIKATYLDRFSNAVTRDYSPEGPTHFPGNGFTRNYTVRVGEKLAGKIANRIQTWRIHLQKEGSGFTNYKQLNDFIYALSSKSDLDQIFDGADSPVKPIQKWSPEGKSFSNEEILALKQAIVANINPNSRLPDPSPNFGMGIRYGDTSKADLKNWTTEFSFSSNGYFKISSLGRVLGPSKPPLGAREVLSDAKLTTYMKYYDTVRMSTQKQFFRGRIDQNTNNIQLYPENLRDYKTPAKRDGYVLLSTQDWENQVSVSEGSAITYNEDFGNGQGPANRGASTVATNVQSKSQLLNDGLFQHDALRYDGIPSPASPGGNDPYLGHTVPSSFSLEKGAISMWVKPTWFGPEFPGQNGQEDAARKGSRTLFSGGGGTPEKFQFNPISKGKKASLVGMNDRISLFIRRYHASENGQMHPIYLIGYRGHIVRSTRGSLGDSTFYDRNYVPSSKELPISRPRSNLHPYIDRNSAAFTDPANWFYPGRWHHVVFQWNRRDSIVLVDGQPDPNGATKNLQFSKNPESWKSFWKLFVGSNRFGTGNAKFPLPFDGTIDDVRIFSEPTFPEHGFTPQDRYVKEGTYEGMIVTRNKDRLSPYSSPYDGRIMNVSWTAYLSGICKNAQIKDFRIFAPKRTRKGRRASPRSSPAPIKWISKSLGAFPESKKSFTRATPSAGKGIPVVKSNEPEQHFNEGISIEKSDQLGVKVTLLRSTESRQNTFCSDSPILDSFTIRIAHDLPKIIRQFYE